MRIAFLTGIWPPDVGGPATHGPDFARFLVGRGHDVRVVTMGDGEPTERPCEVDVVSRRLPFPLRYGQVAARGARAARAADVVYATATYAAAAAAADDRPSPARRQARLRPGLRACAPVSASSPARSRSSRRAATAPVRALKAARTRALRRATAIVVPSAYLAEIAARLGSVRRDRILVLTNPAPPPTQVEPERLEPGTFVFVGRLTRQKALGVAIEAIAQVPRRRLVVVGDGPERRAARAPGGSLRGRRPGELPRPPHARRGAADRRRRRGRPALERLGEPAALRGRGARRSGCPSSRRRSAACPRSSPTARTACSCRQATPEALAAALRRILEEPGLRDRLAAAAKPSVERFVERRRVRQARGDPRRRSHDDR